MTNQLIGRWENTSSENIDAFLKEMGIGLIKRKLAGSIKPTMEYSVSECGTKITQRTISSFITMEHTFQLGVEFEHSVPDEKDEKATSLFTLEGNKLIQVSTMKGVQSVAIREFNGDEMIATHKAGSAVAVRRFRKVKTA